eukprot:CAMPEP_0194414404 /NCGR_PEP_ID=MMETSP0176-20130528/13053_1 /TAXON_ID=216777 /ORGANISM="Proboscia alata, Strain PI-D3" /LENGTH=73 /DNA_ID=CAMNT_0039218369 /DNA_START=747 /DNA_END=968 /DNA_ORIENTATION=+
MSYSSMGGGGATRFAGAPKPAMFRGARAGFGDDSAGSPSLASDRNLLQLRDPFFPTTNAIRVLVLMGETFRPV